MEKVICDVCGIAYPETAAQCPICGCARTENGQTSACDTVQVEEESAYTATKGGRFSKTNVRKRLKAAQIQPVPLEMPARAPKVEEPEFDEDEDYDDYGEDEEDDAPASNRGLIIIVVLLLLAIIAVSSYIAIVHFDIFGSEKPTDSAVDAGISDLTTAPTDEIEDPGVRIPCTGIELMDSEMILGGSIKTMQLSFSIEPLDTTDEREFTSSDPNVATVDSEGRVTAVGDGEATITITCGDITQTCKVTVNMDGTDEPDVPDDPGEPVPELKLKGYDYTVKSKGYVFSIYNGEINASDITWTSDDETIATVKDGKVTCVGVGTTNIRATYKGQVAICIIRNKWVETEEPDVPVDVKYILKINNDDPVYKYQGKDNSAEVTQAVGQKFKLTLVDAELEQIMNDVTWTLSDESVCQLDGNYVVGLSKGTCTITAEYDGVTYLVYVRVTE